MLDNLEILNLSYINIIFIAILIISIIFLGRNMVSGVFDPWFPILIFQLIYCTILSSLYFKNLFRLDDYVYWLISTLSFLLPFSFFKKMTFNNYYYKKINPKNLIFYQLSLFFIIILQFSYDLIFIIKMGVPLFYEYGSNSVIYKDGYGIVKYVHDASKFVLPPLTIFTYFYSKNRFLLLIGLISSLYPSILFEWSKSGLFVILSEYWLALIIFYGKKFNNIKFISISLIACVSFVSYMFINVAASGYADSAFEAFETRLVQSVDSAYYFFILNGRDFIPQSYSFFRYLLSVIAPFLGDNTTPNIGHLLLESVNLPTADGYGPSPPFQLVGYLFFGFFGIMYSLFLGYFFAKIKSILLNTNNNKILIYLVLYNILPIATGDISILAYYVFTIIILILPAFALAFITSRIKFPI